MSSWVLAEPADRLHLVAETDGVWLRSMGGDLSDPRSLRSHLPKTRLGRLLSTLIPQLIELGLAVFENGGVLISYPDFVEIGTSGLDAFDDVVPWAPFTIELETSGWLGGEGFKYFRRFYLGSQVVHLERLGCFVQRAHVIYQLDAQTFLLIETIDSFNALPPEKKATPDAFIRFAEVKGLAEGVGAQLDRYLTDQRVLIPSRVGLDLILEDEGRISFTPKIDGVPPDAMRQAFFALDDIDTVYAVDSSEGRRVRIVLDETQREVLRRMQRVRHLKGADRAEVLRDPRAVFDGVAESIDIDQELFGPRVKGIGDFPFVVQPYLQRSTTGIFEDPEGIAGRRERGKFSAGLKCRYADGSVEDVAFTSREEVLELERTAKIAWRSGEGAVEWNKKSILVDESFVRALGELVQRVIPAKPTAPEHPLTPRRYLLIYTNENELEYEEPYKGEGGDTDLEVPKALKSPDLLKVHQRAGVAWLQRNFRLNRHGCLLADDMGLGKTLQVLTFLAWLIEKGELSRASRDPEAAPWDPILIVTPVILLENETWLNDMRTFFEGDGAIFQPCFSLHGAALKGMRRIGSHGRETIIGEAVLDLERLRQHRIVLTNYETVTNYQHSFARMKEHWTVIVTDEAQEYKTPNTKISHALKSLAPRFRVACTGTPVETRLLDVWNLFDFLQPGHLLGSATEFTKQYESPIEQPSSTNGSAVLSRLKSQLRFGSEDAFVIRRDKTSLPDLPAKHEHRIECTLSAKQREWHLDFVSRARLGGEGNHPLALLHHFMTLYQHPALLPHYEPLASNEAIEYCPKLAAVLDCLHSIQSKGEKALIFTRSLNMQQILVGVLNDQFGLDVEIINGATIRHGDTKDGSRTRRAIVQRFRESSGFNILVLSPDVAGIGLTLVEANHVIHYGRWWNPAKESQATDRVHRIGQKRDVHVYYPIAKDPQGVFETFDEKLDALVQRRRALAAEFLAPMPSEEDLERELLDSTLGTTGTEEGLSGVRPLSKEDVRRLTWDRFEALIAVFEEKRGAQVILTPRSGDGKIDVLAIRAGEIRLIQCKHTLWDASVDADVIAQVLGAFDGYRTRFRRFLTQKITLRPMLVTNGTFTARARTEAKVRDVKLVANSDLWKLLEETPSTPAEVEMMEDRRLASMRDVQAAIERLGHLGSQ